MAAKTRKPGAGGRRASGVQGNRIKATTAFYAAARDPRIAFLDAMRGSGISPADPSEILADGVLHRFRVEGDRPGTRNGWCVLHAEPDHCPAGAFGHWRTGKTHTWRAGGHRLSAAEAMRMNAVLAAATRERDAEQAQCHRDAQERARDIWERSQPANPEHLYLLKKKVQPHGIRQLSGLLVIPLRDAAGEIWSVEFIAPDGTKRFLKGGRKRGCYFSIGKLSERLLIAEGFATAASLHEATGDAVAVAFDCGNLKPVARALCAKFPHVAIVICADNDLSEGNPGLTMAHAAAAAVGGKVAVPPPGYDFNDMAQGVAP